MLTIQRKTAMAIFGAIAALALVGTWGNNRHYLDDGLVTAFKNFAKGTTDNPASRSITVDLFFLALAVMVWMVFEARRLEMRFVWLYVLFGFLVAVSVTVPLFFAVRERTLASREPGSPAGTLSRVDAALLYVLALAFMGYAGYTVAK